MRSLLREGLLDQLALMIHPIVRCSGVRLFGDMSRQADLDLVESRPLESGVLLATYEPARVETSGAGWTTPKSMEQPGMASQ